MLEKLSQRVAYCLERARMCGAKARDAFTLTSRKDFSDLEDRWLVLARSYEFSERLDSRINDLDAQRRYVRSILYLAGGLEYRRDFDAIACMTVAYKEVMNVAKITGAETSECMKVARLIVELVKDGERDPDQICNSVLRLLNVKEQARPRNPSPHGHPRPLD